MLSDSKHTIPEPKLEELATDAAWIMTIDFASSDEYKAKVAGSCGTAIAWEYYLLAKRKALRYIRDNKLRLKLDLSRSGKVRMLVFNPEHPSAANVRQEIPTEKVEHNTDLGGDSCVFCGQNRSQWTSTDDCPLFKAAMVGATIELPEG